jgi:adenylate cyclase class 2
MQEIEVKILEIDRVRMEAKLKEIGATLDFDEELAAVFYDFPDNRLKAAGELLRLRKEGKAIRLTHKSPISHAVVKQMEEWETGVQDWEAMQQILSKLGFLARKQTKKRRTQYEWQGTHVVLDDYQGELAPIPLFLEIEANNEAALFATVEALGFRREDCNSWNTYDLMKHYGLVNSGKSAT